MATIDSAAVPWSDGGGCRNQCAARIGDIQILKTMEKESDKENTSTTNPFRTRTSVPKKDKSIPTILQNTLPSSTPMPTTTTTFLSSQHPLPNPYQQQTQQNFEEKSTTDDNNAIENLASNIAVVQLNDRADRVDAVENNQIEILSKLCSDATKSRPVECNQPNKPMKFQSMYGGVGSSSCGYKSNLPPHIRIMPKTQSLDFGDDDDRTDDLLSSSSKSPSDGKEEMPKLQSFDQASRPIYPNVPYSPYGSPYGSPRIGRRRPPLRESRRISIEQTGSFLQLNQYKLMDQIGQGSYGLVKLAYSEEDSTHYAMKILSKRKLLRKAGLMGRGPKKGTSPLDRVYREIAVLKKLDHPNVVKLVEVLDDPLEDSLYLVFELVQLGEVLTIPNENPLTEERAWSVFRDALLGLEYLHYQRIIHSDIKPGNLLLGECGRVKIADLGVCNEFMGEDASMNNGSTAGTPAFRAPETLLTGQHSYSGKAADIWALGATLYSLVFGNVPFLASNVPAVYEKIKHDDIVFPETRKISPELRDLIERMLDKDPTKRITLPQIKEHIWVTSNALSLLPSEEENCRLVQISDDDINSVVKSIPKLDTLILIKTMLKKHSFLNPFSKGVSGRAPMRGGSRLERFTRAGRSNSAPGAYHMVERQLSSDSILPSVTEDVAVISSLSSVDVADQDEDDFGREKSEAS